MNLCNMQPEQAEQIEVDKQVCFWLNEKRAGRMTKSDIERKIDVMTERQKIRVRSALSRYGKIFLNNSELK